MNELVRIIKMHNIDYELINDNIYINLYIFNVETKKETIKKIKIKNKKQLLNLLGY